VTIFANALFNTWISDPETSLKPMPLALSRDLDVRSAGFGTEAEVTGKLLKEHDEGRDRGAAVDAPPRRTLGPHQGA
jgi:hypothetical protein